MTNTLCYAWVELLQVLLFLLVQKQLERQQLVLHRLGPVELQQKENFSTRLVE
jgi:hypothetical protein